VVGAGDARLHLLELGRDEALGIGQRLLADPAQSFEVLAERRGAGALALVVVRRLAALGGGDLEVVAEDLVVANARAAWAVALTLALLEGGDPLPCVAGQCAVLVELGRDARSDHALFEDRGAVSNRVADRANRLGERRGPGRGEQRRQLQTIQRAKNTRQP